MRYLTLILVMLTLFFQYRLWLGNGNLQELWIKQEQVEELNRTLDGKQARNRALKAEVDNLNSGLAAIEERARRDLGLIAPGETFFQLVDPQNKARSDTE